MILDSKKSPIARFRFAGLLVLAFFLLAAFAGPAAAETQAAPMVVSTTSDVLNGSDGKCSLREAVISSNNRRPYANGAGECKPDGSGPQTVLLPAGLYQLTRIAAAPEDAAVSGDLDIYHHLTIARQGSGLVVIHAAYDYDRVIDITKNKKITISGVTISGGSTSSEGGGIYNRGKLNLENVTLANNEAANSGGGLYNKKIVTLTNVTVTGNTAPSGSGIASGAGKVNVNNSMIVGDSCSGLIQTSGGSSHNLMWQAPGCSNKVFGIEADPNLDPQEIAGLAGVDVLFAIETNSAAANVADNGLCPRDDQIGTARPQGGGCDSGAFEAQGGGGGGGTPEAVNDDYANIEDEELIVNAADGLLKNDITNGSAQMSAAVISDPAGTLNLNNDGSFTYAPPRQFVGIDTFTYAVTGDGGVSNTATVTIDMAEDGRIEVLNTCDSGDHSLRSAIIQANTQAGVDTILFDITDNSCGTQVINVATALPSITQAVVIDGLLQDAVGDSDRTSAFITLNGQDGAFSGLVIPVAGQGTVVRGLVVTNFGGSGFLVGRDGPSNNNIFANNSITHNGDGGVQNGGIDENDGASVCNGVGNQFSGNNFNLNFDLDIDLGCDGYTANDPGDPDGGANQLQNFPIILSANTSGEVTGLLNSLPLTDFTLQLFSSSNCADTDLTELTVVPDDLTTDAIGNVRFTVNVGPLPESSGIVGTATETGTSNTSEYSECIRVSDANTTWPSAKLIHSGDKITQFLDQYGQSRWYKFPISPDSKIVIKLFNLPKNYDLGVHTDVGADYAEQVAATDVNLEIIGAESAPANFNPANFNPANFNPANFNPANFNPANFNPANFNPANFNGYQDSGEVTAPAIFAPANFNPANFNPANFNPANFNPANFNGNAYSAAQTATLIAVSANGGTSPEEVQLNSWNETGFMYIRVTGRQADFDPNNPFDLSLEVIDGDCGNLDLTPGSGSPSGVAGSYQTLILADYTRMGAKYDAASMSQMQAKLADLAGHPQVKGVVVNVGADSRVAAANTQADNKELCPFAKNIVAEKIRDIIQAYRSVNPNLKYVIMVGSDNDIPFYRIPDTTELGQEDNYQVPVDPTSSSDAVQRKNYYLSQNPYESDLAISKESDVIYLPELVSSRLAETPQNVINLITAFENTPVITPQNAVVTGYDFLSDGAEQVRDTFAAATGLNVNDDLLVYNPNTWTATQLAGVLEEQFAANNDHGNDILFVSGHFNPNETLAADYDTRYGATQLRDSGVDLSGSLWLSPGCHMSYNVVNEHSIPATYQPNDDWVQVLANEGATVISGVAYQYGETITVDYGERLYYEIARQLRSNAATNIPLGDAVKYAKLRYLNDTSDWGSFDTKTVMQVLLWGIPNQAINMPGPRLNLAPTTNSVVNALQSSSKGDGGPAQTLGLQQFDLTRVYNSGPQQTTEVFKPLENIDSGGTINASYLKLGAAGAVTTVPGKPVLPKDQVDVSFAGTTLRGVLFLGGDIRDFSGRQPLVSVAATEFSTPHPNFFTSVFDPLRLWSINRFDVLTRDGGSTKLVINPGQYKSTSTGLSTTTLRRFDNISLRLFYSNMKSTFNTGQSINTPGLSGAPTVNQIKAVLNNSGGVDFETLVTVDPSAGIHEVWLTYINEPNPTSAGASASWQSVMLVQDANDSRIWRYTMPNVSNPQNLRFMIQAVSGVGLVSMYNNLGHFYSVAGINSDPEATSLKQLSGPSSGYTSDSAQFSAKLVGEDGSTGIPNQIVFFGLGSIQFPATTNGSGVATVNLPLLVAPGDYEVTAWFLGTPDYLPSSTAGSIPFEVQKLPTSLAIEKVGGGQNASITEGDPIPLVATLTDNNGDPLAEKTLIFSVTPTGGGSAIQKAVITDFNGEAVLGALNVPPGTYTVKANFQGTSALKDSTSPNAGLTVDEGETPGDCPDIAGNLIKNPCFEEGEDPWQFFTNGSGSFVISDDNPYNGQYSGKVTINTQGTNVQLYQKKISLKPNTQYELSFAAYSSNGNDLSVYIHKHTPSYNNYGLANFVVDLQTGWNVYQTTFTTTFSGGPVNDARLRFFMAPYDVNNMTYHFDWVVLREVGAAAAASAADGAALNSSPTAVVLPAESVLSEEPPVLVPPKGQCTPAAGNLLSNSGFESGTAGWTFWSDGQGALTTANADPYECANNAKVSISKAGDNVQLYQQGIALQGGQTYQLRLAARSSGGQDVQLFMHKYAPPFTNYGLNGVQLDLTENWKVFVVEFTALGSGSLSDAQLRLWMAPYGTDGSAFEFDDIVLQPKSAAASASVSTNDVPLFDLNSVQSQDDGGVPADSVQVQGYFLDGDEPGRLAGGYAPEKGEAWCHAARPSRATLQPANGKMSRVVIVGIGSPKNVTVNSIFQNELVGPSPDARFKGSKIWLKSERDDSGDGRVYHINFTATYKGAPTCTHEVVVTVPLDGSTPAVDSGPNYNSTVATP